MTNPTPDMVTALQSFADRHGRGWKGKLADMWANGRDSQEPHSSGLRSVRNQLGPNWLFDRCTVKPAKK